MSKKRNKGKNSNYGYNPSRRPTDDPNVLQENKPVKKFSPGARNLLLADLVYLSICQLLVSNQVIGDATANWMTMVGLVLLLAALWMQFQHWKGPKSNIPKGPTPPRL